MIMFHDIDRPAPLHHREGLTAYLNSKVVEPGVLSDTEYRNLDDDARARYDRERVIYLSGGIVIQTPDLTKARRVLEDCFNENIGRNSGHTGLMINGDSTVGKTTTVKALMKHVYRAYSSHYPGFDPETTIPVVYVEVPAGSTGKMIMKTFADFFGMTVHSGESMASIRAHLTEIIVAAGTQLIVVDELHNLSGRSVSNGETVDVLKSLHNDLPRTFVYAGIDLDRGTLLSGPRGQQLSARFDIMTMSRYNPSDKDDRNTWRGIINGFEKKLPLRHHQIGTLAPLSHYLFERTNGSIGSLSSLLTGSAIAAITDPKITKEEITKELLETRRLAHAANTARATRLKRITKSTGTDKLMSTIVAPA